MVRYWVLFLYSQGKDVHCHHFYNAVKGRPAQEDKNKKSAAYGALGHPEGWVGRVLEGVQDAGHMCTHGWFISMYGENHYSIVISLQLE